MVHTAATTKLDFQVSNSSYSASTLATSRSNNSTITHRASDRVLFVSRLIREDHTKRDNFLCSAWAWASGTGIVKKIFLKRIWKISIQSIHTGGDRTLPLEKRMFIDKGIVDKLLMVCGAIGTNTYPTAKTLSPSHRLPKLAEILATRSPGSRRYGPAVPFLSLDSQSWIKTCFRWSCRVVTIRPRYWRCLTFFRHCNYQKWKAASRVARLAARPPGLWVFSTSCSSICS